MGIQIRKFQADTLQKAIEQIRSEMGDNAIILQTEPIKNPAAFGLLTRTAVEVTAAIDKKELAPRFHATIKEDAKERGGDTSGNNSGKRDWKALFSKSKERDAQKSAQPQVKNPAKAQEKAIVSAKIAEITKAAAVQSSGASAFVGASSKNNVEAAPTIGQLYAMKTFMEPLQKEIETLKSQMSAQTSVHLMNGENPKGTPLKPTAVGARKRIADPLELEFHKLRTDFESFMNEKRYEAAKLPGYFQQLTNYWSERGMSTRQILSFFKGMEEWGSHFDENTPEREALDTVLTALEGKINEANVLAKTGKRIVVLVGPTGVGKTTTVAKLAAYEKLRRHRSVTLLTIDDYKIGGTDQMAHYARILEVPFAKMRSDMSLEDQCKVLDTDVVFIDTFGISPNETDRIASLKKMLNFADPEMAAKLEIHLTLPVGIQPSDVKSFLNCFNDLAPQYLLFTKWDETQNWGGMLTTILESKKPVSFVCHGQAVPDDMSLFSKRDFIERVTTPLAGSGTTSH